ncbi:MAG: TrkA family potassium uptake protein [Candidatus Kapabacteria bacterium]|nr:TrkA family potassium uptake protein [Candidatus Kapabacteria bacterium]
MAIKKFCVIGLGYFGYNLAIRLNDLGTEVLAIDNHQEIIDEISEKVTHAICMDSTDPKAMKGLGLEDMDAVIVAIGENFESSIMTTALLQEIGVKKIYSRVISVVHERLLKLMNVNDLLVPEAEAADHLVKRLVIPGLIESFQISKEYAIYEIPVPKSFIGKNLLELNIRQKYNVNLITIKKVIKKRGLLIIGEREEVEVVGVPNPDDKIPENAVLVLFGRDKDIKNLIED